MSEERYGLWECPVCGDFCWDSAHIHATVCHNGHSVFVGPIEDDGRRAAYSREKDGQGADLIGRRST